MPDKVLLEYDGPIAVITNNNSDKHNAFDDDMDQLLWQILAELRSRTDVRAVIWRAEGKVVLVRPGRGGPSAAARSPVTHHELMTRGHRGVQQMFDLDAPILVACKGWSIGASFQRALLADIRIAAEGARFMLPETTHGVIPDTGGAGRLFQICGHGVASDLVLTGRPMDTAEAYAHGVVSRVVPADQLDATVREMAEKIAAAPFATDQDRTPGDQTPRRAGDPQLDGRGADRPDLPEPFRRLGRVPRRTRREPTAALLQEAEPRMTDNTPQPAAAAADASAETAAKGPYQGLPEPAPLGASVLPPGTYDGTVVFVTGGGTGLGKAIAFEYARLGADIVVASRKDDHLKAAREELEGLGGRVAAVTCDIRDPEQIAEAFDAAEQHFGPPHILINNAAANFPVPAEDMSPNAWRTVVDITLNGTYFCAREFARRHPRGRQPRIHRQHRRLLCLDRRPRLRAPAPPPKRA
ncbi:SDR family NAD(P)-dependent oxidoreductase [Yinghuangia aomiensis]